jgi:subtilisin family serine protease
MHMVISKKAMVYFGRDNKTQALEAIRDISKSVLASYNQSILVEARDEDLKKLQDKGFRIREIRNEPVIQVRGYKVDTEKPEISSTSEASMMAVPSGLTYHILRLAGPMHHDWKSQLEQFGVVFYQILTQDNYYLIGVDSTKIDNLKSFKFVESIVPYHPPLKISPNLITQNLNETIQTPNGITPVEPLSAERASHIPSNEIPVDPDALTGAPNNQVDIRNRGNLELRLFDYKHQQSATDAIRTTGAKIIASKGERIIVFADLKLVPMLAAIPQIREINPYAPPRLHNNIAAEIMNINNLRNNHELDGRGQIIAIADTGLDKGVNDSTMLVDFRNRIVKIYALGRRDDASDLDGHGTHVAGSVLGDGSNSNRKILGMAPAAKLVFQSMLDADRGLGGLDTMIDYGNGLFDVARDNGATIHTNSWGSTRDEENGIFPNGTYDSRATQTDTFAFNNRNFLICFSAGNDGRYPIHNEVSPPGTAKNVLTIGASESRRILPPSVSIRSSPKNPNGLTLDLAEQADNANDVAAFSSVGPITNNRRKPDVVAPGSWILSTRSSVATADRGSDGLVNTQDEDGIYTHEEAVGRGLPGGPIYGTNEQNTPPPPPDSGPLASENYMYLSGTSMATPITAGSCLLIRQYLVEKLGHTPSAALIKALMINGAVDMGMGIPHNRQGWGRIDLNNTLFPAGSNKVQFDDKLDNAVSTTDIRVYKSSVSSQSAPLVVTLVWRDPADDTIQNRLHLRVIHVDSGTISTSDDIHDIRNNVQKVVINSPRLGKYNIEVEGVNVTQGIPELLPAIRQDYVVVAANTNELSLIS